MLDYDTFSEPNRQLILPYEPTAIEDREVITSSEPKVTISPSCGPTKGFIIAVNASGFKPGTTGSWKLVNFDELIPLYGYGFSTSNEGKLSDIIELDDLEEDIYKIYFGEDVDNDGRIDSSSATIYAELNIPCTES